MSQLIQRPLSTAIQPDQTTAISQPAAPTAPPTGIIVAHTHWDREWYLPFEGFRARLVAMLDNLLNYLEADPAFCCFMLDGQAIMVEDYLEVRPEAEPRLRHLIETGRLQIGPWYTSVDTFLPDPEAIVRNLQLGGWVARRFGGQPLPVAYLPDTFSFAGQFPQIYCHFGIESTQVWRGFHPENDAAAVWWEAPDGSRVLALRPPGGYCESAIGVVDGQRFLDEDLPKILTRYDREPYPHRVFLMGCDHFVASPKLPELAEQIAARAGLPVRIGSLADVAALFRTAGDRLPVVRGEQRDSCQTVYLWSVAGTRIPLKQANYRVETALLGVAEPLQALAELVGAGSDRAHLRWAWRLLCQNHPHDSITGCSIDEVHREMETRFARAASAARDAAQRGAKRLAAALDPTQRGQLGAIGLVGLAGGLHRLTVRLHGPAEGLPPFRIVGPAGQAVPFAVTGRGHEGVSYHRLQDAFTTADGQHYVHLVAPAEWVAARRAQPQQFQLPWVEIELEVTAPQAGYQVLRLEPAPALPAVVPANQPATGLENKHLRVWADEQGLFVLDKASGRVCGPLYLSHAGDRGDEYTACPLSEPPVKVVPLAAKARLEKVGLTERLVLPIAARVPARLSVNRQRRIGSVALHGQLTLSLLESRLHIDIDLENLAQNFDLRLKLALPRAVTARGGVPFGLEDRGFPPEHIPAHRLLPDFPLRGWLATQYLDGGGVALLARGLYEGAVQREDGQVELAVTLLRGVDYLSRPDLDTRPGDAGPSVPTPDAQCPGRHHWELALQIFAPGHFDRLPAQAEQFLRPPALFPIQWSAGTAPAALELFQGDARLVVSALKPSEAENGGTILHAYNPTGQPLASGQPGRPVRLDETPVEAPPEVGPFKIAAWQLGG